MPPLQTSALKIVDGFEDAFVVILDPRLKWTGSLDPHLKWTGSLDPHLKQTGSYKFGIAIVMRLVSESVSQSVS